MGGVCDIWEGADDVEIKVVDDSELAVCNCDPSNASGGDSTC